jgi:hypothetical protein
LSAHQFNIPADTSVVFGVNGATISALTNILKENEFVASAGKQ